MTFHSHVRPFVTSLLLSVATLTGVATAQARKFTGTVFAYSPWEHMFKVSSFAPNQEIVVFRLKNRPVFLKLVFVSFGQEQLDKKYLDGNTAIVVRARRDVTCDENAPQFLAPDEPLVTNEEAAKPNEIKDIPIKHKYKIASAYSKSNISPIDHLDCYAVESPRR